MVTSVHVSGLCELTDDDWDYRTTATSFMLASRCLAAPTLMKNTFMQAWSTKTCMHTCTHTAIFYGFKALECFLWCQWHFWTSMTNVYDQFFSSLSVPCSLKLLSSEVEPHYYSTTWESLPLFQREIWQLLNPSILPSLYCVQCRIETCLVLINLLVGTSAMHHLPYAVFFMALQSISLNQYERK